MGMVKRNGAVRESTKRLVWRRVLLALVVSTSLAGCMAVPIIGMANLAHKSGTMTITLEGRGDAIKAFRDAAIRSGGTVPSVQSDFARAEFSSEDIKVDAQVTGATVKTVVLKTSSLSNVGRTYATKDDITEVTEKVADAMVSAGFTVQSKKRDRGI